VAKVGRSHHGEDDSAPRMALRRLEAANALSISVATLDRLTKAGDIRCVKHHALKIYPVEELTRWLRSRIQ
jgi:predicted site-specific integrase-resolvase